MATEGVETLASQASINNANTPIATTPLLATSMIPLHQRYPITPWAPRTGRTSVYHQWRRNVGRLLAAFSLSWEDIQQDTPIAYIADIKPEAGAVTRARAADDALRTEAWQRVNTALYWHIEPSLLLVGPDRARGERFMDANLNKHLAHGRAIIRWACSFANTDSLEQQTKLTADVGAARLKAGSTWSEVDVFVQLLHDKWSRIAINQTAQSLHGFWRQLLVAMPTEPAGSHLTGLRTWLAGHVVGYGQLDLGAAMPKGAPRLHSLDDALNDMKQHAENIGLPSGQFNGKVVGGIIAALGGGDTGCLSLEPGDGIVGDSASLHALGANGSASGTPRVAANAQPGKTPMQNACDFCDNNGCQSKTRGGRCISKHDSAFDVDKHCSKGQARRVKLTRQYHKQHPNVSTLKGVQLTVTAAPAGAAAAGGVLLTYGELLGADGERNELDEWLAEHDCLGPGVWGIGDLVNGLGDMLLVTVNVSASAAPAAPATAECQPCDGDRGSGDGDGGAVAQQAAELAAQSVNAAGVDAAAGSVEAAGGDGTGIVASDGRGEADALRAAVAVARAAQLAAEHSVQSVRSPWWSIAHVLPHYPLAWLRRARHRSRRRLCRHRLNCSRSQDGG